MPLGASVQYPQDSFQTAYLRERLSLERGASPHTCDSYAHTFRLLFDYAASRFNVTPSKLFLKQFDASLVMDFLANLETVRGNGGKTRNARLAAIKSFMRYVEHREPALLGQSLRIQAIPSKKTDTALIGFLTPSEMEAVLNAPDVATRIGIRDRAMLHVGFAAGLRVSELTGLLLSNVTLQPIPTVCVIGKGRKQRALPLWKQAASDLRAWMAVRGELATPELFVNARGQAMTRSGFSFILKQHVQAAARQCPSLENKRASPHVLRHTCAMVLFRATGDLRKVSLWLGHAQMQTTEVYLRADPMEKIEAVEGITPMRLKRGRFSVPDQLIASLQAR
ncbi:MAG: site-specific integrase [Burkholderiales bacterium]|nr:site-specific integrase [Burkholderiales bacterium]